MGKKGGGSAPAAPDPVKTAQAQTATNKETALWNAVLNNVNQITPYGTLNYTQTGGGKKYDDAGYTAAQTAYATKQAELQDIINKGGSQGSVNSAKANLNMLKAPTKNDYLLSDMPPTFTSEIKLSPEQQALYDTQTRSDNALASLGEGQIGRITDSVSTPFSYSGIADGFTEADTAAASQRGEQAILSRLDPRFAQDEESLRTRLINQGIGQGSEAYRREMEQFNQTKNDARNQAIIQGANYGGTLQQQALERRNQGINEYTTQRNAPLNEYIGLTSGSQVQNPTFNDTNYQGAQSVDYAGLVNNQYQQQLAQYNANQAGSNSLMGGLFSLGGSVASGGFSGLFK